MMDDRKAQSTQDRLYIYGRQKLRHKTLFEMQRNSEKEVKFTNTVVEPHRGKAAQDALYEMHRQKLAKIEMVKK
jgi:hypothetical protein